MGSLLHHKVLEARSVHLVRQFAGDQQRGVTDGFGLQPAPVRSPIVDAATVNLRKVLFPISRVTIGGHRRATRLKVNRAGHNQFVQLLDGLRCCDPLAAVTKQRLVGSDGARNEPSDKQTTVAVETGTTHGRTQQSG